MMNVLAISLVLTSLFTATVWSPSPSSPPQHEDHSEQVIVKDGHRVVVVEYDKEADGSTKVLISPHDGAAAAEAGTSGEKIKPSEGIFSGPRELVCDAYGKCKHKIADALGKTKHKVDEIEENAKGAVNEAIGKGSQAKEKLPEKVSETGEKGGAVFGKAKESVAHGIDKAKKVAEDVVETVKDGATKVKSFDVVDSPKRIGEDIGRNMTGNVKESVKETVENVQEVGEKSLAEISRKIKDVTYDVFRYFVSRDKVDAVVGLIHMLGFSTAYGMCVWVTFISSYILGRYLPKQQFGVVQSRIYPVYFKAMAYCVSATLFGYLAKRKNEIRTIMTEFQGVNLLSALLMVFANMIFLEPRATKVMYERMKIEKEEGRGAAGPTIDGVGVAVADYGGTQTVSSTVGRPGPEIRQDVLRLNGRLKRLNAYSSALNVATLIALTWHMAYMGRQLQANP